ncbi:outer membrane lipoprotein carrier protein LolA [Enterovibrio baiacu]|uniref:outer membrane lipoprotein carrier protein LolA n=1 Tax=Enterovibrio baiacu TaxID=2491023 RepID=UPI0010126A3D|nr:outer membrane lipoprotein carrier protein LolA [Enterovibrio baiacu]MBE1276905.1 outer membrane lipoprotein carrier protein LolA [Enterovibrio baiacu]
MLNKYRRWLSALLLFVCAFPAHALTLSDLQTRLSAHDITRGDFTQTRHLAMLDMPLVSQGAFLLSQHHGLLWQQTTPFPLSLVLTGTTLTQRIPGQADNIVNADDNPMVFYFSRLFLSLFQGDTDALAAQFDLQLTGSTEKWKLVLTPKQPPLSQVFKEITLQGAEHIDILTLHEVRGDHSDIRFTNVTFEPTNLTEEEHSEFGD